MSEGQHSTPEIRSYLIGLALALALTAVPFAVVATHALAARVTYATIAVCALVQIVVHLRYFLHVGIARTARETLVLLTFATVLIVIMVGGTLWIMFDLHIRMAGG